MIIGVCLLLLLVMLLSIPVLLWFEFDLNQTSDNKIEMGWFFGWIKFQIPLQQKTDPPPNYTSNKPNEQKSEKSGKSIFKLMLQKRFRQRLITYFSDVWRAIAKKDIKFHMKIGLDDPADTGQLWAIVGPTSVLLAQAQQMSLVVEPDFTTTKFEFDGQGTLRVIPLMIIFITLKLLCSPAVWQGLRQIRAGKQP